MFKNKANDIENSINETENSPRDKINEIMTKINETGNENDNDNENGNENGNELTVSEKLRTELDKEDINNINDHLNKEKTKPEMIKEIKEILEVDYDIENPDISKKCKCNEKKDKVEDKEDKEYKVDKVEDKVEE